MVLPSLRMDLDYIFWYNNLAKLIVTGLLPFVSLCVFNFKASRTSDGITNHVKGHEKRSRDTLLILKKSALHGSLDFVNPPLGSLGNSKKNFVFKSKVRLG